MTRPRLKPRAPRLRWYLALARLHAARLWALPARERVLRMGAVFLGLAVFGLVVWDQLHPVPVATTADGKPVAVQAALTLVVQIAILVISALLSYALAPKPKPPEKVEAKAPVVDDGKGIVRLYGLCWFDDSMVLAFKQMGTKKIRAKGGKKG
jgi:hypothetical protein